MQVLCKIHLHKQCPLVLCCEFYDSPVDRNGKVRLSACLGWLSQKVDRTKTRTQIFWFKFSIFILPYTGLPRWFSGRESACWCRRHRFNPWVRKIPWRRKWQPTPVFLPGKSHGQRSLVGYSPWGYKESGTTEWLSIHMHLTSRSGLKMAMSSITHISMVGLFLGGSGTVAANSCHNL